MGPAGLTAVFGMGTGVTPPVWSPENRPAGCQATPAAMFAMVGHSTNRDHITSECKWARSATNQSQPWVIWHLRLSFAICHRVGEATGSSCLRRACD